MDKKSTSPQDPSPKTQDGSEATIYITDPWPICRPGQIHVKDPLSSIAILCCWTKKDKLIKEMDGTGTVYNSIGQLYTERGISPLVRNLLANAIIHTVLICGKDISGAGKQLYKLMSTHKLGTLESLSDIPAELLAELTGKIRFHYCPDIPLGEIYLIPGIWPYSESGLINRDPVSFPEPKPDASYFPAPNFGHKVAGRTIPEVYLKMLQYILRFGAVTNTHYEDPQKEVLAMQNIITDPGPVWDVGQNELLADVPAWMPEDGKHVQAYINEKILSGQHYPDLKYTYGELINAYPTITSDVNQLDNVVLKIVHDTDQRSAVISLWDVHDHSAKKSGTPCLNHIQFRVRHKRLFMHCLIRSNDMFAGWPENCYAMRAMQEVFLSRLKSYGSKFGEIELGELCITSMSAHLYADTWEAARDLVAAHLQEHAVKPWKDWDERGQFEVRREGDQIVATLIKDDKPLQEWRAATAKGLCNRVALDVATDNISSLMWLAREAGKIELEIRNEK